MSNMRWRVELHQSERDELEALPSGGREGVRRIKRAQILLAADQGTSNAEIAKQVGCALSTVTRTRRRFVEGSLEWAKSETPRPGAARKRSTDNETLLVATACSKPPPHCLPLLGLHSLRRSTGCCLQGSPVRRWCRFEGALRRASRRRGIAHPSAQSRQVELCSGSVSPFLPSLLDAPNANGVVRHTIPQRRPPPAARHIECRRDELYSCQPAEALPAVAATIVQHRIPWQVETRTGDTT